MNNQGPFRIGQFANKIDEKGMKAAQVCVDLSFVSNVFNNTAEQITFKLKKPLISKKSDVISLI